MTEDLQIEPSDIQNKIYIFRSQRVMLDADLTELYGVENKRLKEAVRRNIERFEGEDFMFQLSANEITELSRTQFATLNKTRGLLSFTEIWTISTYILVSHLINYLQNR